MYLQTVIEAEAGKRSSTRKRCAILIAIGSIASALCACAPVQQGADQCKDLNVNLVELKDAKYASLSVAEGGLSASVRAEIDAKVQEFMESTDVPINGCAIAVTRDNQIVYLQAYGLADEATDRAFTIATPSAIGSISKTLTSLGLLAMVQDGKLDLDAPLLGQMGLVPGVDTGWSSDPTLREVLAHKGGYIDGPPVWNPAAFTDGPSMSAAFPAIEYPSLQPLLVFQGYKSEAGNQVAAQIGTPTYSNVGFSLAGALLDYRSKMVDIPSYMRGYERYIWYRVGRGSQSTEPTMITANLATDFRTSDIKNFAQGYDVDGNAFGFGDSIVAGWGWEGPSGGWALTIGDLARLMLILQSDAVIDKTTIDSDMRQNYGTLFSNGTRAGLGLEIANDGTWFGKGGDIFGYTSDFKIWPSNSGPDWGVAFLCNQQTAGKGLTGDIHQILKSTSSSGVGINDTGETREPVVTDPLVELEKQYEPVVREFAERYLSRGGSTEDAWRRARRELLLYPNGSKLVKMLEGGNLKGALKLLPRVVPAG